MERPNAWKDYTAEQLDELHYLCEGYKAYISDNKTERECCAAAVSLAEEAGYVDLAAKIAAGEALKPGDKVSAVNRGKALMLVNLGTDPLEQGVNMASVVRNLTSSVTHLVKQIAELQSVDVKVHIEGLRASR